MATNMIRRNCWLILAILSLLGMVMVPQGHSAPFQIRVARPISLGNTIVPPARPIPGRPWNGRTQIGLPGPAIPLPVIRRVVVDRFLAQDRAEPFFQSGPAPFYPAARKMFSQKEGPDAQSLGKAFDNSGEAAQEAPAVSASEAPEVEVQEGAQKSKKEEGKKAKKPGRQEPSRRLTLPTRDLENEIGIN